MVSPGMNGVIKSGKGAGSLQSDAQRNAGVGIEEIELTLVFLKVEIIELRLRANKVVAPVVSYADTQVKVETEHTVVTL